MTTEEMLRRAESELLAAGDIDAYADARWLLCRLLGCGRAGLRFAAPPDVRRCAEFWALVKRRAGGEPLQYILGDQPFLGRSFKTDARALIPRPETEEVCLKALELIKGVSAPRALDVGTGTGALAISIALERPDAQVAAVDISPDALALARENAEKLGAQVEFLRGDLFEKVRGRKFDLIISNPPYISGADMKLLQREVLREPELALYGGADGLDFYRRIAAGAGELQPRGGQVALEVGAGQARDVCALLAQNDYGAEIFRDMNGVERIVCARRG